MKYLFRLNRRLVIKE